MNELKTVDLGDLVGAGNAARPLVSVNLSQDQVPIVPFTITGVRINLHYCKEPEIKAYVACNGADCVLCKIGRKIDERLLVPVYEPVAQCVNVLMISPSMRPGALLPQFVAHFQDAEKANAKVIMFISRLPDNQSFKVESRHLREGEDDGVTQIKQFLDDINSKKASLSSVVAHMTNAELRLVGSIAKMLSLKEGGQA